ncbi:hypothetical protein HMP0015_2758 [Acinetobacter haemolyticus ATCC 19194]|uniref:Uncharacterized protein n=1 Tax=Acinetobacter haemolyticus ATCC 19194 TaxID=707232 RepID=D4XSR6_ACIHA|nr:hypothetical protein HMP0015_2758 [Acinetobacter haemolyticus ATCC 19194]
MRQCFGAYKINTYVNHNAYITQALALNNGSKIIFKTYWGLHNRFIMVHLFV